ncbi:MAG: hypothetical protein WBW92_02990 [Rhodanobacteraceae bacterium]
MLEKGEQLSVPVPFFLLEPVGEYDVDAEFERTNIHGGIGDPRIAGLVGGSAMVRVGPPLLPSGASPGESLILVEWLVWSAAESDTLVSDVFDDQASSDTKVERAWPVRFKCAGRELKL